MVRYPGVGEMIRKNMGETGRHLTITKYDMCKLG